MNLPLRDRILLWEPALRGRQCAPVTVFGKPLRDKVQRLYDVLGHHSGVGIAAPQIGIFERFCIANHPDLQLVMVNPEILEFKGETADWEGCLSLPAASAKGNVLNNAVRVRRAREVKVKFQDHNGTWYEENYRNYPARVVQHEIEHLVGVFVIDRTSSLYKEMALDRYRKFVKRCVDG